MFCNHSGGRYRRGILLLLIVFQQTGCYEGKYRVFTAKSPAGGGEYRCSTKLKGGCFSATIVQQGAGKSLRLHGKPDCIAVNHPGSVLALGLSPSEVNEQGHCYLSKSPEVVLIDTESFREYSRIRLRPPNMPEPSTCPYGYLSGIQRFDCITLSDDAKKVATCFSRPVCRTGVVLSENVVIVWDTSTALPLNEFTIPNIETGEELSDVAIGMFVSDLDISPRGELVAISGFWCSKDPEVSLFRPFLYVWNVENGTHSSVRLEAEFVPHSLCFDKNGEYLAGCDWAATQKGAAVEVIVIQLTTGRKVTTRLISGRLLDTAVTRGAQAGTFNIVMSDGRQFVMPCHRSSDNQSYLELQEP